MGWSIRKKLIILLIAATVVPFGTGIVITYFQTTKSLNTQFVTTSHEQLRKGEEELTGYLDDVAQMSSVLYRYTPFMTVMQSGISERNMVIDQEEIRRALAYIFNSRTEIEQMHLYINKGKDSYTNYHSNISGRGKYQDVYSNPYYAKFLHYSGFSIIESPHLIYSYNHLSFIPNSEKKKVLSFHNIIRDVPADKFLGFLSIDINLSKINDIAGRLYTPGKEDLYIINEKGTVIYSSNEKEIGKQNHSKWMQEVKSAPHSGKSLEWRDKTFSGVIVYDKFSDMYKGWYIVKMIPYSVLYQSARETALINILIGIITLLIMIIAMTAVSVKITEPIKVLIGNMKKVEKGDFEADFDSLGNDEIGLLGKQFKQMIARINKLIEREYKLEIDNKASQLQALQSQINPHFLYNTLQSIGTSALKVNAANVYTLLTTLSAMMRYSMNMKNDIVPLSAELKHVHSYLTLQKQRFEEQFEFHLTVEKHTEAILVPKMLLQPIVENCFKHGFDQFTGQKVIGIKTELDADGMARLSVKDNGKGVTEEELARIRRTLYEGMGEDEIRRDTIGLKNIYDRLQIYYQYKAKMAVSSGKDGGFTVTITIPKEFGKEVEES